MCSIPNSDQMLSAAKREIRRNMLATVKNLGDDAKKLAAQDMLEKITRHPKYLEAEQISVFISMPHEICTLNLIDISLKQGKRVFVPKVAGQTMRMLELRSTNEIHKFSRTKWGIPEPPENRPELADEPEQLPRTLLVVPAVAFNHDGKRLGYGGGYYDKYLTKLSQHIIYVTKERAFTTLGIGFQCQLMQRALPTNEQDYCLDEIIVS